MSPACTTRKVYATNYTEEEYKEAESYAVVEKSTVMPVLMAESVSCAILDTACNTTVCGIDWLESYTQTLSEEEKSRVEEQESGTVFRFGDGVEYKSMKKAKFPVNIIGNRASVTSDVVDCSIPLLLSKKSMKRAQMKIDLENYTAIIHGKTVQLSCTPSGH